MEIADRVCKTELKNANITIKDHKENFINNPKCRLLNPTKTELGKISKQILAKLIKVVRNKTKFNQWSNTHSALEWFKNLEFNKKSTFIQFDIISFYPSISSKLLNKALDWASNFAEITKENRDIIIHAKRSLLYSEGKLWVKKENPDFDVGMGSFDGAETCDIVVLYILSQLQHLGVNIGMYKDDGLAFSNLTPRQTDVTKKKICQVFAENQLKITIDANMTVVDFLDVTLDISNGSYKPYAKPNYSISVLTATIHPQSSRTYLWH